MFRNSPHALFLIAVATVTPFLLGQTQQPQPKREHFQNAEVLYTWV